MPAYRQISRLQAEQPGFHLPCQFIQPTRTHQKQQTPGQQSTAGLPQAMCSIPGLLLPIQQTGAAQKAVGEAIWEDRVGLGVWLREGTAAGGDAPGAVLVVVGGNARGHGALQVLAWAIGVGEGAIWGPLD